MRKLSMLDKSINIINSKYNEFSEWAHYETHWANGEYISESAHINRMLIADSVLDSTPITDTHVGSMGETCNSKDYVIVKNDSSVVRVEPICRNHQSNYAYEEPWTEDGLTVREFMRKRGIKIDNVKFIVEIVENYESWNETERERSVTIFGRKFSPQTVLESFKHIYGKDPWVLHTTSRPETAFGWMNMDVQDYEKVRERQRQLDNEFIDNQTFVRTLMKNVFGEEIASRLENFINFGEY